MTHTTSSEADTERLAAGWARTLRPGDTVALFGDLGAGKTAFVRGLAAGLGYAGRVTSPTFNILHEYAGPVTLHHYDMYRLNGPGDLDELGFYETLEAGGIVAIEWSERIEPALPPNARHVTITRVDDNTRTITIED